MRHHHFGLAVGDDAAGVHADQAVDDLQKHMDDMLDPDDADAAALETLDGVNEFLRFGIGQPAADLVEQDHFGLGGQRPGELEPLSVEQAERLGLAIGDRQHAADVEGLNDPLIASSRLFTSECEAAT